jgi:hypothetical protein
MRLTSISEILALLRSKYLYLEIHQLQAKDLFENMLKLLLWNLAIVGENS